MWHRRLARAFAGTHGRGARATREESRMFDVSLNRNRNRLCNGVSRRDFIRVGALAPFGLSVAGWLSAQRAAVAQSAGALAKATRAKSVILVFLGGGISHHDSFDMKP